MPFFALQLKAQFDNVDQLCPVSDDYRIMCRVKCTACHEEHPKAVLIVPSESLDLSGSRGSANLVLKCQFCKKETSAKFPEPTTKQPRFTPYSVPEDGASQFQTLCKIEFRGLEPLSWEPDPENPFACDSTQSKTKFTDVEFDDGTWTDYDEAGSCEVSIMDLESQWTRA